MDDIVNLIIIWTVLLHQLSPFSFSDYLQAKNNLYAPIWEDFKETLATSREQDIPAEKPPPYQRVSSVGKKE